MIENSGSLDRALVFWLFRSKYLTKDYYVLPCLSKVEIALASPICVVTLLTLGVIWLNQLADALEAYQSLHLRLGRIFALLLRIATFLKTGVMAQPVHFLLQVMCFGVEGQSPTEYTVAPYRSSLKLKATEKLGDNEDS